jgi:hypothetical protein
MPHISKCYLQEPFLEPVSFLHAKSPNVDMVRIRTAIGNEISGIVGEGVSEIALAGIGGA